jgi:hypothetical protein
METIKFTSRASVKIKDSYYTFEATIERTVPEGIDDEGYDNFKHDLWNEVNGEVDTQIIEITDFLKSNNKL